MKNRNFWISMTAVATLSGILYCSWPLGYILNPTVAKQGLASGFEGLHQPFSWLFISGDVSSSLLITLVCWLLWRRLGSVVKQKRLLAAVLLGVVVFAAGTIVSALLPERCQPSLQSCPNFMHDRVLFIHGIASIAASFFLFVSLVLVWWQRRSDVLMSLLIAGYILFGFLSSLSLFYDGIGNSSQQYYITLCSLWLALLPYAVHKALFRLEVTPAKGQGANDTQG
jgi:hypothetical protein